MEIAFKKTGRYLRKSNQKFHKQGAGEGAQNEVMSKDAAPVERVPILRRGTIAPMTTVAELKTVRGGRAPNAGGDRGVGRGRVSATSAEGQQGGVERVLVQCDTSGGGLSGVGHVRGTAEAETLSVLGAGRGVDGTRHSREIEAKTGHSTYPRIMQDILITR